MRDIDSLQNSVGVDGVHLALGAGIGVALNGGLDLRVALGVRDQEGLVRIEFVVARLQSGARLPGLSHLAQLVISAALVLSPRRALRVGSRNETRNGRKTSANEADAGFGVAKKIRFG